MKIIYQKFIIMLSCIITVLIILCSKNPMSPEYHFDESLEYVGQIRSNLSTYIVLRQDSSLWSWGFNANGTLGNGTLKSCSFPVRIKNVSKSVFVDMCDGIGVAMDNEGDIWFWGYAYPYREPHLSARRIISYIIPPQSRWRSETWNPSTDDMKNRRRCLP